MVGACFVALAVYILYESSAMLIRHVPLEHSIAGIVIAAISVIVMPLLAPYGLWAQLLRGDSNTLRDRSEQSSEAAQFPICRQRWIVIKVPGCVDAPP